jgi:hypothetical protein
MRNRPRKGKTTVKLLAGLVDEDRAALWHLPGLSTFPFYLGFVALFLLVISLLYAMAQVSPPIGIGLFAAAVSVVGIAVSYGLASIHLFVSAFKQDRSSRICKKPAFKPFNTPRNKLILSSLIAIAENVQTTLAETMATVPDVFREERLLHYAVDAQFNLHKDWRAEA